ncbi:MAG TPA: Fic family protein, partial [Solirubrobacteraceae bacterium]
MSTAVADTSRDEKRSYKASHPWVTFSVDLREADRRFWQMIGEARSKSRHLMYTPLKPNISRMMESIYLAKGMQATTAIEGNTLTLEQVQSAVQGTLKVPPSQEYLKQEVDNVLQACRAIEQGIAGAGEFQLSRDLLSSLNERVLHALEVPDHVVPGVYREVSVVVGPYRGAPPGDIPYLVERMCDWLNGSTFDAPDHSDAFLFAFLKAVAAHVYLAWIHPFGDGNGRTARLIEFGILTAAGIPSVAAHLLSNHYNLTRSAYYRHLDESSRSGGDLSPFLLYAARGFVDLLQEQLSVVHEEMFNIAWENYVHERFQTRSGEAARRQRELVIALGRLDRP